jgi:16S rRNA (cytosine967-C5)-methyltransferase
MSGVSPARRVAYQVIRRVFEQGAFADRALHAEAHAIEDPRDRALAMNLAYGTIQRRRTLDHLIAEYSSRPPDKLDPPIRAALELGLYQLAFADGIAEHAAVNESVELAKAASQAANRGAQLVNAVLRRATREARDDLRRLTDETPQQAAIKHSVPDWIAELWFAELGPDEARRLLDQINRPPESALRVNALKRPPPELPVASHLDPELPEARVLEQPFDVFASPLWSEGRVMPQSRGSMLVARALAPQPGERVLDLCAAPGGKTTHLAALMGDRGAVTAIEVHPGRAEALRRTCARMGATAVQVIDADGREYRAAEPYHRVLVDPPCSGLGTLQSRPDLRWQPRRGDPARQLALLKAGAGALAPGGTLVYSVCTISRAEGHDVIAQAGLEVEHIRQTLPHRDGTDGFFIARLRRR